MGLSAQVEGDSKPVSVVTKRLISTHYKDNNLEKLLIYFISIAVMGVYPILESNRVELLRRIRIGMQFTDFVEITKACNFENPLSYIL